MHCDTLALITAKDGALFKNDGHFDIERAQLSNLWVQFFALFTMPTDANIALKNVLLQMEKFHTELEINRDYLYLIKNFTDIDNNSHKIGAILHLEGAEAIGRDIETLSLLYRLGLRSLGLTWNYRNFLADGVAEGQADGGLTNFGKQVIKEMDRLGIMMDLSHVGSRSFFEAFDYYNKPIMITHANAYAICPHRRNLTDEQLKVLADNDGIIGINQVDFFLNETANAGINDLLAHIKYIADTIGVRYIALGSDFDGADKIVMSGVEEYNRWEGILAGAGFIDDEISQILNKNALRVVSQILT
ncbi:MAG: membrane dipeptidase [Syntrophomonadaceae bacterium]|nr:membrane dipeptidase [Syntrophomonadaceae bacterium]